MLKYNNYAKDDEDIEILFNGKVLDIENKLGRELIDTMRNIYFHMFDLVSMTGFDEVKKKLLKNKSKAIIVDLMGKLINEYAEKKDPSVFTNAISIDGAVIKELDMFSWFIFNEAHNKEFFFKEAVRVFIDAILELSIIKSGGFNGQKESNENK